MLAASRDDRAQSLRRNIEAVLFVATEPLSVERLATITRDSADAVRAALRQLGEDLRGHGITLLTVAGGYRLATAPCVATAVAAYRGKVDVHLSTAAYEVLAIVAHEQPVTRGDIDDLRGVSSASVVETLLRHGLIQERGHRESPGRPALLHTTTTFLEAFGLWDARELGARASAATGPESAPR